MQIVNKITMKTLFGEIKEYVIKDDQIDLLQILGVVKKKELFKSTFGKEERSSWCLIGTFKAQKLNTKEMFYSNRCFLPDLAANLIADQIEGDDNLVQFAFVIGVKYAKNLMGYEYTVKPLVAPVESEVMTALENQVAGALPAPKKGEYVMDQHPEPQLGPQVGPPPQDRSFEEFNQSEIK